MEAGEVRPACLLRAHQVEYSRIVWCEAYPISFSEILSPLRHEVSRPQIFLTVCFGAPYSEAYTGRASVPPRGAGKEEEDHETETSKLARGLPPARGKTLKVGASPSPSSIVGAGDSSRRADEPPLEVLPISVWCPTSRGAAPLPTMPDKVTGNRDRSEAVGDEDSLLSHAELAVGALSSILRDSDLRRVGALPVEEALALLLQGTTFIRPSAFVDLFFFFLGRCLLIRKAWQGGPALPRAPSGRRSLIRLRLLP